MGRFYYPASGGATRERSLARSGIPLGGERRGAERLPHPLERAPQQPRDVHLRDADALGDLALREPGEEAQQQDAALALAQRAEAAAELDALLGGLVARVLGPDPRDRLSVFPERLVERDGAVGLRALKRFEHLLRRRAGRLREILDRRRAAELRREAVDFARDAGAQLLQPARDAHGPRTVAEVALDLAQDRRHRKGREAQLATEVEAIDRLDEPDAADLLEIVERLAAVRVTSSERSDERHHALDQENARLLVALLVPATQQLVLVNGRIDRQASERCGHVVPPSWRNRLWPCSRDAGR